MQERITQATTTMILSQDTVVQVAAVGAQQVEMDITIQGAQEEQL